MAAGDEPQARQTQAVLSVSGMHCASCAALVEEELTQRPGVISAVVELEGGRATVAYDPDRCDVADLCQAVRQAGYDAAAS